MPGNREWLVPAEFIKRKPTNLYEALKLPFLASPGEVKESYRRLAMRYHPDQAGTKTPEEIQADEERFKEVDEAYQILAQPEKKLKYDFDTMEAETEKAMHTWKECGGPDFANKPQEYEMLARDEEAFFNSLFRTDQAKEKATKVLSDLGFHRAPDVKDRFPYTFIDTDPGDTDGASNIVYEARALRKDAKDLGSAAQKIVEEWGEKEGVLDALGIKQKIRDYIDTARRKFFTPQAIAYSEAAIKMYGSKQKRRQTEFFLTNSDSLLKQMKAYDETAQVNLLPQQEGVDKKKLATSLRGRRLLFVGHLETIGLE